MNLVCYKDEMVEPTTVPEAEDAGLFEGLNPDDPGIRMLGAAAAEPDEAVLLVHCGDVPGVAPGATRLILDVREQSGAGHDCVADLPATQTFDAALVWPRAHLGKDFSERCLAQGALHLRRGGRLLCAARKQKGGKSLAKTMGRLLGHVEVIARDRGYHLYCATRGDDFSADLARELLEREYTFSDPLFGDIPLGSVPGVFSRRELDAGTRALLHVAEAVAQEEGTPSSHVLDLCAGVGPLAIWAARCWPEARVLALDSNLRAVACIVANARRHGLELGDTGGGGGRLWAEASDGFPAEDPADFRGKIGLALINPPTHADAGTLASLLGPLSSWLAPGGRALLVIKRPGKVVEWLKASGATLRGGETGGYIVLQARWS